VRKHVTPEYEKSFKTGKQETYVKNTFGKNNIKYGGEVHGAGSLLA